VRISIRQTCHIAPRKERPVIRNTCRSIAYRNKSGHSIMHNTWKHNTRRG
jgi:hypothetical protein